jgi:hypothetical protein
MSGIADLLRRAYPRPMPGRSFTPAPGGLAGLMQSYMAQRQGTGGNQPPSVAPTAPSMSTPSRPQVATPPMSGPSPPMQAMRPRVMGMRPRNPWEQMP